MTMTFQGNKHYLLLAPQSVASSATATSNLDTRGWGEAQVTFHLGAGATTTGPAVMKLSESDTTVVTSFADISAFVAGSGFTAAAVLTTSAATSPAVVMNVDLRGRKRYLKASFTPSTGGAGLVAITAQLSRGKESASSASEAGSDVVVNG